MTVVDKTLAVESTGAVQIEEQQTGAGATVAHRIVPRACPRLIPGNRSWRIRESITDEHVAIDQPEPETDSAAQS